MDDLPETPSIEFEDLAIGDVIERTGLPWSYEIIDKYCYGDTYRVDVRLHSKLDGREGPIREETPESWTQKLESGPMRLVSGPRFKDTPKIWLPSPDSECNHGVTFDAEAAYGLSSAEVQRRWPRHSGTCPACGYYGAYYASYEHYLAGDW